jgi:outer membrane protein assembly factor BamE (lipoprotein component of BamABCDE complex)
MRWIAILSALVLAACSAVPENSPQPETQESINQKITKGKTTKADVKSMFGEPVSTTSKERGAEEWRYKMANSSSTVKIPGFEKFFGSSTDKDKMLLVDFDRRGIVSSYSLNEDSK